VGTKYGEYIKSMQIGKQVEFWSVKKGKRVNRTVAERVLTRKSCDLRSYTKHFFTHFSALFEEKTKEWRKRLRMGRARIRERFLSLLADAILGRANIGKLEKLLKPMVFPQAKAAKEGEMEVEEDVARKERRAKAQARLQSMLTAFQEVRSIRGNRRVLVCYGDQCLS
jgi:hypothetical protein